MADDDSTRFRPRGGASRESEDTAPGQRSSAWSGGWFGLRQAIGGRAARERENARPSADEREWPFERPGVELPTLREVTAPTDSHAAERIAPVRPLNDWDFTEVRGAAGKGVPERPREQPRPILREPETTGDGRPEPGAAEPAGRRGESPRRAGAETSQPRERGAPLPRFLPGGQTLREVSGSPAWATEPAPQHEPFPSGDQGPVRFLPPTAGGGSPPAGPAGSAGTGPRPWEETVDVTRGEHQLHLATVPLRTLVVALVFFAVPGFALMGPGLGFGLELVLGLTLVVMGGAAASAVATWRRTTFQLRDDHLVVRTGLLWRASREVPLSRLQAVDVVRPLLIQILGLAELRVELAGGDRSEVRLRYLSWGKAKRLRAALLAHAAGLSGQTPEAPEWGFYRLSFGRLLGAMAFRIPVLAAFAMFLLLILMGVAFGELGVLGGAVPLLLGLMRGFLGPLLRYTEFRAAISPDGLRLRYGVFQTRMQTVPPGRVQAVRIVQPMLWQALGVVRVEANVAGYVGERQMDSSTLMPVVPRNLAFTLVSHLFPGTDAARVHLVPAKRSWSRQDAVGMDDVVFVTRRGVFCRIIEIIPHARVQSLRLTAGPLDHWLGTATVEADTAPGPVRARAVGRDLEEARRILDGVSERAHRARSSTAGPERWATRGETTSA